MNVKKQLRSLLPAMFAVLLGLLVAFPVIYGFFGAFKQDSEFVLRTLLPASFQHPDAFLRAWTQVPMAQYLFNSLVVAVLTASVRLLLAVPASYAFAFYDFRGKTILFLLIIGTMMLPAETLLVTNYRTVARMNLLDTYTGMAITSFVGAGQVFMLRQRFKSFPKELHEAADIDGCGETRFMLQILLPIEMPVLVTLTLQSLIAAWNGYLWPLMVTNTTAMRTVQVGISMLSNTDGMDYALVLAGVTISVIPAVAAFLILRKHIASQMIAGAVND